MDATRRKTIFILSLALCLVIALLAILLDDELLIRLGDSLWFVALIVVACVVVVLSGYAFDLNLQKRLRTLRARTNAPFDPDEKNGRADHDEIIALARNIERMARTLQKMEASYRGIVEDQSDLICRFGPEGRLSFVNGAYARAFARKPTELVGQPFPYFRPGGAAADQPFKFEHELKLPNGQRAIVGWSERAIRDHDGTIVEFQAVGHDITLLKESEATLLRARDAAEAADRAKTDFLAVVSHEIRTPINGVIGFAKMLEDSPLSAEQREQVAMIHTSGLALEKLIGEMLDFSKIEAGTIKLEHNGFALHRCVEDVCTNFTPQARASGLTLDVNIEPGVPPLVNGDGTRLRQVLANLIGNALKFTEHGGVKVRVSHATGEPVGDGVHHRVTVFFAVTDTGIGIAPDKIPELFQPFMQIDASSKRRHGGTGIGLAISKRLCALMGGTLAAESRPGEGSTFRFSIVADYDKQDTPELFALPTPGFRPRLAPGKP